MAAGLVGEVEVSGLKELLRACRKMSKDLEQDLVWELEEAAQPVRRLTEQYILGGGGGFGEMVGVDSYWASMRLGVSRALGTVWMAPFWRRNAGTPQGQVLKVHFLFRMEGAVEDKGSEIEKRMGDWIDRMADDWGSHLAA